MYGNSVLAKVGAPAQISSSKSFHYNQHLLNSRHPNNIASFCRSYILMRYCKNLSLVWGALLLSLLTGCAERRDYQQTLRSNFVAPSSHPQVLAAYQPWFGNSSHVNVGYSSQDPVVLQQQIEKAKNLGISGFVVNWYGPSKEFEDHAYSLLQQAAARSGFTCALMYDESEDASRSTDDAIRDLTYAYENY